MKSEKNAKASGSRSASPKYEEDHIIDLAHSEDEIDLDWSDEKQLLKSSQKVAEDDQFVLEEEANKQPPLPAKKRGNSPSHLLGPICPICSKTLGMGTSNQGLNEHIDWCLNRDAIRGASSNGEERPDKRKTIDVSRDVVEVASDGEVRLGAGKKKKAKIKDSAKGSMMEWLSRAG